jgi:hypothetical protein
MEGIELVIQIGSKKKIINEMIKILSFEIRKDIFQDICDIYFVGGTIHHPED